MNSTSLCRACPKCDSVMRRRELRSGYRCVCTNRECGFIQDDQPVISAQEMDTETKNGNEPSIAV